MGGERGSIGSVLAAGHDDDDLYIYIYIYIYTDSTNQKNLATLNNFLFLILKVLFLMKQVKQHNSFIYYNKFESP